MQFSQSTSKAAVNSKPPQGGKQEFHPENSRQFWTAVQAGRDAALVYLYLESMGDERSLPATSELLRRRTPARYFDAALAEFRLVLGSEFTVRLEPDSPVLIQIERSSQLVKFSPHSLGRLLQRSRLKRELTQPRLNLSPPRYSP